MLGARRLLALRRTDELFGSWKVWERGAPHVAVEIISDHDVFLTGAEADAERIQADAERIHADAGRIRADAERIRELEAELTRRQS